MARCGRPRLRNAMAQCDSTAITTQPRWRRSRAARRSRASGASACRASPGGLERVVDRLRSRRVALKLRMAVVRLVRARREDQAVIRDLAAPTERVDGEAAGIKVDRPPLRASRSRCAGVAARRESAARCRPQRGFRSPSDEAAAQTGDGWLGRSLSHRRPRAAAPWPRTGHENRADDRNAGPPPSQLACNHELP